MKVVISTQKIEAKGLLSTIKDILNKLSDGWMKLVDKLGMGNDDSPMRVASGEKLKNGGESVKFDIDDGTSATVVIEPVTDDKNGEWRIYAESNNGLIKRNFATKSSPFTGTKAECYKKRDEWTEVVMSALDKHVTQASTNLKFAVSRTPIKGSKEDSINLVAINANYELGEALEHMEAVVGSQEFIDLLPDDGQAYEVNVEPSMEDDELVLTTGPIIEYVAEDFSTYDLLAELLKELVIMQYNFRTLLWNLKGKDAIPLLDAIQSFQWDINSQIDFVGDLCHMLYGITPNPCNLLFVATTNTTEVGMIEPNPVTKCISYVEAYGYVYNMLTDYKNLLENIYVNFTDDVKLRFAESLYSAKQMIHRLDRIADDGVCDDNIPLIIQPEGSIEV